jgi:signal transduction histidine kinase/ActR/RegA family two-component response regulator
VRREPEARAAGSARHGRGPRLAALFEIGRDLVAGDGSTESLERLFARAAALLDLDVTLHHQPTERGDALELVAASGLPPNALAALNSIPSEGQLCGRVAAARERVVIEGLDACDEAAATALRAHGVLCYCGVPLTEQGELIGTLAFGSRERGRFRARQLELIDTFASLVSTQLGRLRNERRLAAAAARLRAADQRKDEFLAVLAHELRNPLAPIRNSVQLLEAAGAVADPTVRDACAVIDRQVQHLMRLVDDLLDMGRIGRGTVALATERIDLREVVRQALETSRPLFAAACHEVALTLPEEPVAVAGDFTRLVQVAANLLNNAAKFTPTGGRVEVTVEPPTPDAAALRVRDNGRGMDSATLANVFDMFYQRTRGAAREGGGLGIGLALVKNLVTLHGGTVEAASAGVGQGSEFVVRLPRAPAQLASGDTAASPLRVLVVDDNRDAADSTVLLLSIQGYEASAAYDGEEAVTRACALRPDVVLLDLELPKQSGYDACRAMRAAGLDDAFIVAVTGFGDPGVRQRALDSGCDEHRVKPIGRAVIEQLLAPLVVRKDARREVPPCSDRQDRTRAHGGGSS